ncbi:MAG: hypothetical protein U9R38_03165 [Candidatus Margulisiibacteriota bacterium]|nr:hypothetical protein [Candidatus Margulisiibacteriota bacterium]
MPLETNNIFGNQPPQPKSNDLARLGGADTGITRLITDSKQDDQILSLAQKLKTPARDLVFNIPTGKTAEARKKREQFVKILRDNDDRSRPKLQITKRTIAALKTAGFIKNPESYSTAFLLSNVLYNGLKALASFVEVRIPETTSLPAARSTGPTSGKKQITRHEALSYLKASIILSPREAGRVFGQFEKNLSIFLSNNPSGSSSLRRFRWFAARALKRIRGFAAQAAKADRATAKKLVGQIVAERRKVEARYKSLVRREVYGESREYKQFGIQMNNTRGQVSREFNSRKVSRLFSLGGAYLAKAKRAVQRGNIAAALKYYVKGGRIRDRISMYMRYVIEAGSAQRVLGEIDVCLSNVSYRITPRLRKNIMAEYVKLQASLSGIKRSGAKFLRWSRGLEGVAVKYEKNGVVLRRGVQKLGLVAQALKDRKSLANLKLPVGFKALELSYRSLVRQTNYLIKEMITSRSITTKIQNKYKVISRAIGGLRFGLIHLKPGDGSVSKFVRGLGLPYMELSTGLLRKRDPKTKIHDAYASDRLDQLIKWDNNSGGKLGLARSARIFRRNKTALLTRAYGRGVFKYGEFMRFAVRTSQLMVVADYRRSRAGLQAMGIRVDRSSDERFVLDISKKMARGEQVSRGEAKRFTAALSRLQGIAETYRWAERLQNGGFVNTVISRVCAKLPPKLESRVRGLLRAAFKGGFDKIPAINASLKKLYALASKGRTGSSGTLALKKDIQRRIQLIVMSAQMRVLVKHANNAQWNAGVKFLRNSRFSDASGLDSAARKNLGNLKGFTRAIRSGQSLTLSYSNTKVRIPGELGGLSDSQFHGLVKKYFRPTNNFVKAAYGTAGFIDKWENIFTSIALLAVSLGVAKLFTLPFELASAYSTAKAAQTATRFWRIASVVARGSVHVARGFAFTGINRQLESRIMGVKHKEGFFKSAIWSTAMFYAHGKLLRKLKLDGLARNTAGQLVAKPLSFSKNLLRLGVVDTGFFTVWGIFKQVMDSNQSLSQIFSYKNIKGQFGSALQFSIAMGLAGGAAKRGAKSLRNARLKVGARIRDLRTRRLYGVAKGYQVRINALYEKLQKLGTAAETFGQRVHLLKKIAKLSNRYERSVLNLRRKDVLPGSTYRAILRFNRRIKRLAAEAVTTESQLREAGINVGPSSTFMARLARFVRTPAKVITLDENSALKKSLGIKYVYSRGVELTSDVITQTLALCKRKNIATADILVVSKARNGQIKVRIVNYKGSHWQIRKAGNGYQIFSNVNKPMHFKPLSLADTIKRMVGLGSFWRFAYDQRGQIGSVRSPEVTKVGKFTAENRAKTQTLGVKKLGIFIQKLVWGADQTKIVRLGDSDYYRVEARTTEGGAAKIYYTYVNKQALALLKQVIDIKTRVDRHTKRGGVFVLNASNVSINGQVYRIPKGVRGLFRRYIINIKFDIHKNSGEIPGVGRRVAEPDSRAVIAEPGISNRGVTPPLATPSAPSRHRFVTKETVIDSGEGMPSAKRLAGGPDRSGGVGKLAVPRVQKRDYSGLRTKEVLFALGREGGVVKLAQSDRIKFTPVPGNKGQYYIFIYNVKGRSIQYQYKVSMNTKNSIQGIVRNTNKKPLDISGWSDSKVFGQVFDSGTLRKASLNGNHQVRPETLPNGGLITHYRITIFKNNHRIVYRVSAHQRGEFMSRMGDVIGSMPRPISTPAAGRHITEPAGRADQRKVGTAVILKPGQEGEVLKSFKNHYRKGEVTVLPGQNASKFILVIGPKGKQKAYIIDAGFKAQLIMRMTEFHNSNGVGHRVPEAGRHSGNGGTGVGIKGPIQSLKHIGAPKEAWNVLHGKGEKIGQVTLTGRKIKEGVYEGRMLDGNYKEVRVAVVIAKKPKGSWVSGAQEFYADYLKVKNAGEQGRGPRVHGLVAVSNQAKVNYGYAYRLK